MRTGVMFKIGNAGRRIFCCRCNTDRSARRFRPLFFPAGPQTNVGMLDVRISGRPDVDVELIQ